MADPGKLFLIPNVIADNTAEQVIHPYVKEQLRFVHHFLAEDVRTARRFLSSLKIYDAIESLNFSVLNKDTHPSELESLFLPIIEGKNLGIISESGCPGVADPGAIAVAYAHTLGIKVIPLVGPSSILLALMASGLSGQEFAFHGYLPIDKSEAISAIRAYEKESKTRNQTQIFIETPHRNNQLCKLMLQSLKNDTQLCIAVDLTGEQEFVCTKPVGVWKKKTEEWPKMPAIFMFLAS